MGYTPPPPSPAAPDVRTRAPQGTELFHEMAAEQEMVVLTRDEKHKATVNLHGLLLTEH